MQDGFNKDLYRDSSKTDIVALTLAFIGTLLIHVGTYYLVPSEFASFKSEKEKNDELKIEVLPPKYERKLPEYIEANPFGNNEKPLSPDAPESYKDQRAADEIPDPTSKSKKPFVKGEIKDGNKIVSGTMSEQNVISPSEIIETLERPLEQPAQPTQLSQQAQNQTSNGQSQTTKETSSERTSENAKEISESKSTSESESNKIDDSKISKSDDKKETAPDKTEEKTALKDENGFIKVEKISDKKTDSAKEISNEVKEKKSDIKRDIAEKKSTAETNADNKKSEQSAAQKSVDETRAPQENKDEQKQENEQKENLPRPRPRPTLSMKTPAGPLADNPTRASNRGVVSCDSRFSEFGAYQQRMIEAISRQWNLIATKYDLGSAIGTFVIIEFYLNSMGELSKFQIIHTTSTNTGTGLCEQAILTTAPYGEWTQEMVNTFSGQDQSVRITFHYR